MAAFISVVFILLTFIAVFIGSNINMAFKVSSTYKILYWILLFFTTYIYVLMRIATRALDFRLPSFIYYTASFIFAVVIFMFTACLFIDIVLILSKYIPFAKPLYKYALTNPSKIGYFGILLVVIQVVAGIYGVNNFKTTHYTVVTDKIASGQKIRIAVVSDVHVSPYTTKSRLNKMVDIINESEPDIVVIAGDLFDDASEPYLKLNANEIFAGIHATYGTYVIFGNHEYYNHEADKIAKIIDESSMALLRDKAVYIEDLDITLVGRDDLTGSLSAYGSKPRLFINQLTKNTPENKYTIVLDHIPSSNAISEAKDANADLLISGHTHHGQFFPGNLFTKFIYKVSWGHLKDDDLNIIVSCGFGTWGPPLRSLSYSEVVVIDIIGKKDATIK